MISCLGCLFASHNGAELLHKAGVNNEIARLMKIEKDIPIRLNLIRCIGELCKKGIDICKDVLKSCGVPFFLDILNSKNEEVINASSYIIQVSVKKILDTFTSAGRRERENSKGSMRQFL